VSSYYYTCVLILLYMCVLLCVDRPNPDQPSYERSGRWLTFLRKRLAAAGGGAGGEFVRERLGLRVAVVAATQVCVCYVYNGGQGRAAGEFQSRTRC
jgi:hypothetical protein